MRPSPTNEDGARLLGATWGRAMVCALACASLLLGVPGPSGSHLTPGETATEAGAFQVDGAILPASGTVFDREDDRLLAGFRSELTRLMGTGSRTERWGLLVVSLDQGDTIYALNHDEAMAPASNMKLFTSAAALHLLGPDFRFPTYLLADGPVIDGVLEGNLVLFGTGDPTLGSLSPERPSDAYDHFVAALRSAGIRSVRGGVSGDGSFYSGDPRRPSWNPSDLDNWYAAPVSSLIFNENMVTLRVAAERGPGLPTTVRTIPEGAGVPIRNESRVQAGGGPRLAMLRDAPDDPVRVVGAMSPRQIESWRRLTVSDPPSYAASVLAATLRASGIEVRGGDRHGVIRTAPGSRITGRTLVAPALAPGEELRTLAIHHSPPVSELIHPVNKRSHNLFAETLLLAIGRVTGETADFEGGARALSRFLVEEVGVDERSLHVEDGSGLSRLNRTSAAGLVRLLGWMDASPHGAAFAASLPVAGTRQELPRMARTPAAGNLAAKTGTIHRTSALSGIVRGANGERLLFSILVNDVPSTGAAKRVEDRIGEHLASFRRALAPQPAEVASNEARRLGGLHAPAAPADTQLRGQLGAVDLR
jgi:serine-type D-Ala-D-Ala carboxypeptidase/endopeptidase (penicillin-binding protein 4)